MAESNANAAREGERRDLGSAGLEKKSDVLKRAYRAAVMADKVRLMGTDEQRSQLVRIETWRTQSRRRVDEIFEEKKGQYHRNEILRLQKARGARRHEHPAPFGGLVDAMDGPGVEREAWQNVLGRQQKRRVGIEERRIEM